MEIDPVLHLGVVGQGEQVGDQIEASVDQRLVDPVIDDAVRAEVLLDRSQVGLELFHGIRIAGQITADIDDRDAFFGNAFRDVGRD